MKLTGCGLYGVGIVIGSSDGALVLVEKKPRKTERLQERRRNGHTVHEPVYEDVLEFCGVERLSGRIDDMAARACELLAVPPIADEYTAALDTQGVGRAVRMLFARRKCNVHQVETISPPDADDSVVVLGVESLQPVVTFAFQSERLTTVDDLREGVTLLRALENLAALPVSGPTRTLALAGALAVYIADGWATRGPWASRQQPIPPNHEAVALERKLAFACRPKPRNPIIESHMRMHERLRGGRRVG